jgi:hypothetical protein
MMIKDISGGSGITVSGGSTIAPYINMTAPSAGMVRYNGNISILEVYDGGNWAPIHGTHASIQLDPRTQTIIKWAEQKMREETERNKLAETNPAVKDLVKQIEEKQEQIEVIATLVKSETQHHRV